MAKVAQVMTVVNHDGSVLWIPPVTFFVRCQCAGNDVTNCSLKSVVISVIIRFIRVKDTIKIVLARP